MIIILFILLISCIAFLYLYYNKKIDMLRKQLIINRNKHSSIQKNNNINRTRNSKILINFISPSSKSGILKAQSNIYLSPLHDSYVLKNISIDSEVIVLDCAELNNETWFYISLLESSPINSRGWINSKNLSLNNTDSI